MTECTIKLPFPPSVNTMYANMPKRGRIKTAAYRDWANEAGWMLNSQKPSKFQEPVTINYTFGPKGGRLWDLSNHIKAVEDLLVRQCILPDDNSKIIVGFSVDQDPEVDGLQLTIRKAAA